jgi:hypothetical protein
MRKIKLSIEAITESLTGLELNEKCALSVTARCTGKKISFTRKALIEASLQVPKPLEVLVTSSSEIVTVEISQTFKTHRAVKCYILELTSEELTDLNSLDSSMKKLTKFIRSIEEDLQDEILKSAIKINKIQWIN